MTSLAALAQSFYVLGDYRSLYSDGLIEPCEQRLSKSIDVVGVNVINVEPFWGSALSAPAPLSALDTNLSSSYVAVSVLLSSLLKKAAILFTLILVMASEWAPRLFPTVA